MTDDSPGTVGINLVPQLKGKNIDLCIICQHKKDSKGESKLTSTENGRTILIDASRFFEDGIIQDLDEASLKIIQYHLHSCFSSYRKKWERAKKRSLDHEPSDPSPSTTSYINHTNRPKRSKLLSTQPSPNEKTCIICYHIKCHGDSKRYRVSERDCANNLLKATAFYKDIVQTRIVFLETIEDVFAADIMYHKGCLRKYLKGFQRDVDALMSSNFENDINPDAITVCHRIFNELDIKSQGYSLSDVRDEINKQIPCAAISNRSLKNMLIDYFGETICFTYPKEINKSQMFYSVSIKSEDVAETLRRVDVVEMCAEKLQKECKLYDFELSGSFNSAEDADLSYNKYTNNRPPTWERFFNAMFPYRPNSVPLHRKCDTIFQIFHYMLHNGNVRTPFHISCAELIHDTCRSKILLQIFNKLGLSISYHDLLEIDIGLAQRIIDAAGPHRTPVSSDIESSVLIHGAMDNFDHDERTLSGKGGSHDTILMLFQNNPMNTGKPFNKMSKKPESMKGGKRSLETILTCQKLLKRGNFIKGNIPKSFIPSKKLCFSSINKKAIMEHKLWVLIRNFQPGYENIPSFPAVKSLLNQNSNILTRCAFTPIIPHPATEADTIFTTMVNFQDVLNQKKLKAGPLWSDEGVYRIAKEIQLSDPDKFNNIFLGIGGFHLEKVVIGCLGSYLEKSGIKEVFVEQEVFGPGVVNSVMNGGHYVRGKRGMSLLAESMERLQFQAFMQQCDNRTLENLKYEVGLLQTLMESPKKNEKDIRSHWNVCLTELDLIEQDLNKFVKAGSESSPLFSYWSKFISELVPVLRDLTRSFRDSDWILHLSAVHRAIPLCFAFDRINYKRWLPVYYEDCLTLPTKFPDIYSEFVKGNFVVMHSMKKSSALPMDQALEKEYNKPAKSQSGIIGFTRRKEAVCKWNLIKHEKAKYRGFLYAACQMDDEDEYSLHHEYASSTTLIDQQNNSLLIEYILQRTNPFERAEGSTELINIATGTKVEVEEVDFLLNCVSLGESARDEFYESRFEKKTASLFDKITKTKKTKQKSKKKQVIYDVAKETVNFLRTIDYSRLRNFDLKLLLTYEITPTSFYLMKDGFIRKSNKSELTNELKKQIPKKEILKSLPSTENQRAIVIDFMAYARKVPVIKQKLKTYRDFMTHIWNSFQSISATCTRIDIIFDLYHDQSIKASERKRRAKNDGIVTFITNLNQPLPIEMDKFWGISKNKVALQQIFIQFITEEICNNNFEKELFLGGSHKQGHMKCYSVLNGVFQEQRLLECYHEEADDRIFFHVNNAVKVGNFGSVAIASPDTDVFINATYHFKNLGLQELWVVSGRSDSRSAIPIHNLVSSMDPDFVQVLPAIHSLTGCDTTSKFSTKTKAVKMGLKKGFDLLNSFGRETINDNIIADAEAFLLSCITTHDVNSFDELRHIVYHEKHSKFDIEKFPPTSATVEQHIRRAFLQCYMWTHAPYNEQIVINQENYGYVFDEDNDIIPLLTNDLISPEDFPLPCNCLKCSKGTVCPCRIKGIMCCFYCKCNSGLSCKNPLNESK